MLACAAIGPLEVNGPTPNPIRALTRPPADTTYRPGANGSYGARFVEEYIDTTTGADSLNVGEYWVDLAWSGPDLQYNQDAARQRLCDWIKAAGQR